MKSKESNYYKIAGNILICLAITIALYLISTKSFLLFHSTVEVMTIVIAGSLFVIAWNTRKLITNSYIKYLGLTFIFVALLDFIHTLAYKGMNIFTANDADLPTQLWITARYIQSISLIIASYVVGKKIKTNLVLSIYAIITILLSTLIFLRMFPFCYVEGTGLTTYKKVSEYVISVFLIFALWRLHVQKGYFENKIRKMLYLSMILSIISEVLFTFYISVYGISNFLGHIFKLFSFYLLYRAIVVSGLQQPYSTLFRDLEQSEEKYHSLFKNMIVAFALHKIVVDKENKPMDYIFIDVNPAFEKLTGLKKDDIIDKRVTKVLPGTERDPADWIGRYGKVALEGGELRFENYSQTIGKWFYIVAYSPKKGYFATIFSDITQRKDDEEKIRKLKERLKTASSILRHDITNDLVVVQSALELYRDEGDKNMLDEADMRLDECFEKIAMHKEHESYLEENMELEEMDIKKVLEKVTEHSNNIEIELYGSGKIYADNAVYSIIENILQNSITHGEAHKIDIDIIGDHEFLKVRISDDGKKLPAEVKEKMFDKGYHYGPKGHTGIGLWIVRKTMEEFGGDVYVEDNEPTGTVIVLEFRKVVEGNI